MWSRFQRVLNLETHHGRLLCLHTARVPLTPFSLLLETAPETHWPEPGTAACLQDHCLTVGRVRVDLSRTHVMPAIKVPKPEACWTARPAVAALEPIVSEGVFGAWWDEQSTSRETLAAALSALAQKALRRLVAATRASRSGTFEVVAAAEQLIGLGPGGTPSGDDALIGFLGAWLRLGSRRAEASNVAAVLAPRAHARTTRLAAEFYYHLAHGRLSYQLDQLLRAVALRDGRLVAHAADRLARYGATSGRDTIAGVHAYLQTRLAANGKAG